MTTKSGWIDVSATPPAPEPSPNDSVDALVDMALDDSAVPELPNFTPEPSAQLERVYCAGCFLKVIENHQPYVTDPSDFSRYHIVCWLEQHPLESNGSSNRDDAPNDAAVPTP